MDNKDKLNYYWAHIPVIEIIDKHLGELEKLKDHYQVRSNVELLWKLKSEIADLKKLIKPGSTHV